MIVASTSMNPPLSISAARRKGNHLKQCSVSDFAYEFCKTQTHAAVGQALFRELGADGEAEYLLIDGDEIHLKGASGRPYKSLSALY